MLDLRAADAYAAGHIPGAIQINLWGLSLTDTDPAPLNAFMWMIEHVLQLHGVTASTPVVAYDEQSGVRAARAFWFLEYLRPFVGAGARRRIRRVDARGLAGDAATPDRRRRVNGRAGARRARSRPGAKSAMRSRGRMPSLSTRAATASTAARPSAPSEEAPFHAPSTSSGPATSRPKATSNRQLS